MALGISVFSPVYPPQTAGVLEEELCGWVLVLRSCEVIRQTLTLTRGSPGRPPSLC